MEVLAADELVPAVEVLDVEVDGLAAGAAGLLGRTRTRTRRGRRKEEEGDATITHIDAGRTKEEDEEGGGGGGGGRRRRMRRREKEGGGMMRRRGAKEPTVSPLKLQK